MTDVRTLDSSPTSVPRRRSSTAPGAASGPFAVAADRISSVLVTPIRRLGRASSKLSLIEPTEGWARILAETIGE